MGNWAICITGVGAHHNNRPLLDADGITKEFVQVLENAGHTVHNATFTYGATENMTACDAIAHDPKSHE